MIIRTTGINPNNINIPANPSAAETLVNAVKEKNNPIRRDKIPKMRNKVSLLVVLFDDSMVDADTICCKIKIFVCSRIVWHLEEPQY